MRVWRLLQAFSAVHFSRNGDFCRAPRGGCSASSGSSARRRLPMAKIPRNFELCCAWGLSFDISMQDVESLLHQDIFHKRAVASWLLYDVDVLPSEEEKALYKSMAYIEQLRLAPPGSSWLLPPHHGSP